MAKYGPLHSYDEDQVLQNPEIVRPADFNLINTDFDNALIAVSNLVARATTKWTLDETKLFLMAVSQLPLLDSDCWVVLQKKEITRALGIDTRHSNRLRLQFDKVRKHSDVRLNGPGADEWDDGSLIRRVKSDKKNIYVQFDSYYLPLLSRLKNHFTAFYLKHILSLNHKSSYCLYVWLTSWFDRRFMEQHQILPKKDLATVFNLKEGQYWRGYGTEKAKFDWANFEKRCLLPALKDIENQIECDLNILECRKVKTEEGIILGYEFFYDYRWPDGQVKNSNDRASDHMARESQNTPVPKPLTLEMYDRNSTFPKWQDWERLAIELIEFDICNGFEDEAQKVINSFSESLTDEEVQEYLNANSQKKSKHNLSKFDIDRARIRGLIENKGYAKKSGGTQSYIKVHIKK